MVRDAAEIIDTERPGPALYFLGEALCDEAVNRLRVDGFGLVLQGPDAERDNHV
jgi:hypothetical protein